MLASGMSRTSSSRRATLAARPRLGALLALVALLFQAFVVQTHVEHAGAPLSSDTAAAYVAQTAHAAGREDAPTACFLCQELALSGAFLQATPPALTLGETFALTIAPAASFTAPRTFPAHAWQSRAPPISL